MGSKELGETWSKSVQIERTDWSSCIAGRRTKLYRIRKQLLVSARKLANSFQTFDADRTCDQVAKNDALKRTGVLDS